jgi:hypothetical protein
MAYSLGGYYLIYPTPIAFGSQVSKIVCTCSTCINESLLDSWSYSWTTSNDENIEQIKTAFALTQDNIISIRNWVDDAENEKRIGWPNVFKDMDTLREYRQKFFSNLPDIRIISMYFEETEADDLLREFKPREKHFGEIGLYENLLKKIPEIQEPTESHLGFDIIGIEGGGDFHTFHCHDLGADLVQRFNLEVNEHGLFTAIDDSKAIGQFMNDQENGFEPVPWFVCKTKLVTA